MNDDLASLQAETEAAIAAAADLRALDAVRVGVLGKSGSLTGLLKGLGAVPAEQRKDRGAALNRLKGAIEAALEARRAVLDAAALDARLAAERMDVTLPPRPFAAGTAAEGGIHPIARTLEELTALFGAMGFAVAEGRTSRATGTISARSTSLTTIRRGRTTTPSTCPRRMAAARSCARTPARCRSAR